MRPALLRHCQRCCHASVPRIHRQITPSTRVHSLSSEPALPSALQPASTHRVTFSTWSLSREAFLRPGPGRDFGSRVASSQATISSTSSASIPESNKEHHGQESLGIDLQPSAETPPSSKRATFKERTYKEIILLETDFRERFIKGGGNGGQKINKTNSNVELKHLETGIVVQCQATRSLPQNRKLARKILIARLDEYYNGELSKRGQKAEKIREKKRRMARKSAKKYHGRDDDDDDDDDDIDDIGDDEVDLVLDGPDDVKEDFDNNPASTEVREKLQGSRKQKKDPTVQDPLADIQLTTLEEILAGDNKKPSRRKSARKDGSN